MDAKAFIILKVEKTLFPHGMEKLPVVIFIYYNIGHTVYYCKLVFLQQMKVVML